MNTSLTLKEKVVPDILIRQNTSAAKVCLQIISIAIEKKASDIHVEALKDGALRVRVRIDGDLTCLDKRELRNNLISREVVLHLKRLAKMNVTVTDQIQDGAFQLNAMNVRFRVALSPSLHGESFVIRVIYADKKPILDPEVYGADFVLQVKSVLQKSQGIIILSGPTGSGKSTTMQAMISELKLEAIKVISIEDPIEREMVGVLQKQITSKVKWPDAIKMALREDPDVIYIGEIRDSESASLAIEASKTGHLVLTTIHANTSTEIIDRLKYLGIDEYEIKRNVEMLVAQRLVKKASGGRMPVIETSEYHNDELVCNESISEKLAKLHQCGMIEMSEVLKWQTRK